MKLENIMKDRRLKEGDWFTTPERSYKIKWNGKIFVYKNNDNDIIRAYYVMPLDFFYNNWKWVEERWYEGDFKKKYPNGVLCWVWNDIDDEDSPSMRIVMNYDKDSKYPFKTYYDLENNQNFYKYAKPVKPEEAPAIIGGKK